MIHSEDVRCPHCFGNNLQKNGKSCNSIQRRYCKSCKKYFQREYFYIAYHPGIKEKIIDMTLNGSGVRDIGRVLHINNNTVVSVLKKTLKTNPYFPSKIETGNLDEFEVDIRFEGEMK